MIDKEQIMPENEFDLLEIQDQEAAKNSYYRYPVISPHIIHHGAYEEVKTINGSIHITKLEEVILYILSEFKFIPTWLVDMWCNDYKKNSKTIITNVVGSGIVWIEPSVMGLFLRPTKFLLEMMHIEDQRYKNIPFGLLNHTCAEEQIMFDVMMGNTKSELWVTLSQNKLLPCYRPLELKDGYKSGAVILHEALFTTSRWKDKELLDRYDKLIREIKASADKPFTSEFNDFTLFTIVYPGERDNVETQRPDMIVPIPRLNGQPKSCAIELELSAKTPARYNKIMLSYKNNLLFGSLYYLCGNNYIAKLVLDAYNNIGGLGSCKLYIINYVSPAAKLTEFTREDMESQKHLLKLSLKNTKAIKKGTT